jgi:Holliday junction resolvasome RuvABC endonuclease subunit
MFAEGWVWGVDVAVSRLAIACASLASDAVDVETLATRTDTTEGERLGLLDRRIRFHARALGCRFPPAVVWVEQPSGRFRALQLTYATGVVQAAMFEALGVPVFTVPSSAWKRRTVGVGNATKSQVRAWVDRLGVEVGDQDQADAVAIAVAGRAMVRAGLWDVAA